MTTKQEGVDPEVIPEELREDIKEQRGLTSEHELYFAPDPMGDKVDKGIQKLWDALETFDIPRQKVFELLAPHSERIQKFLNPSRHEGLRPHTIIRDPSHPQSFPALDKFWEEQKGKLEKK